LDDVQAVREDIEKQYPSTSVHVYAFDRSSEVSVNSFIQEVANTTGRIDFAINVVSQPQPSTMPIGHDIEQFDKDFKLYQRGVSQLSPLSTHHITS
jgi:NAD(P)-dependent dehydrogenase (short-subunit alcohol dehydrogenase family)